MCNEAARLRSLGDISAEFNQLKIPLRFPEGLPNLGQAPSIRITDATVIVRASRDGIVRAARDGIVRTAADDAQAAEMVTRRWSWPGTSTGTGGSKPVYNFRSEGRRFGRSAPGEPGFGRCLIPVDAFFEFTAPAAGAPKSTRKDKWRFTAADGGLLGVAGLWRAGVVEAEDGADARATEAFTMLTCAPGPDIAPYHSRQIVLIPRAAWADWLGVGARGLVAAAELTRPTPAGTLAVARAR